MRVLHLGRPEWNEGDVLSTEHWSQSHYWEARRNGTFAKPLPDLGPLSALFTSIGPFLEMAGKSSEVLKEYVFEDARRRLFDAKPSRWRCIFAVPAASSEDEAVNTLRAMNLLSGGKNLVLLELLGDRIHYGDSRLLNCNANYVVEIERFAQQYWAAEGTPDELLYEGPFRVERIVRRDV